LDMSSFLDLSRKKSGHAWRLPLSANVMADVRFSDRHSLEASVASLAWASLAIHRTSPCPREAMVPCDRLQVCEIVVI
jgi:hypothetical protein